MKPSEYLPTIVLSVSVIFIFGMVFVAQANTDVMFRDTQRFARHCYNQDLGYMTVDYKHFCVDYKGEGQMDIELINSTSVLG